MPPLIALNNWQNDTVHIHCVAYVYTGYFLAGNHANHKIWVSSMTIQNLWLMLMGMKQKNWILSFHSYMTFIRTAWQPYRLNHVLVLCINLPDFHGLNLVIFFKIENWLIWKNESFEFSNFQLKNSIPFKISPKSWGSTNGTQFLWFAWFQN